MAGHAIQAAALPPPLSPHQLDAVHAMRTRRRASLARHTAGVHRWREPPELREPGEPATQARSRAQASAVAGVDGNGRHAQPPHHAGSVPAMHRKPTTGGGGRSPPAGCAEQIQRARWCVDRFRLKLPLQAFWCFRILWFVLMCRRSCALVGWLGERGSVRCPHEACSCGSSTSEPGACRITCRLRRRTPAATGQSSLVRGGQPLGRAARPARAKHGHSRRRFGSLLLWRQQCGVAFESSRCSHTRYGSAEDPRLKPPAPVRLRRCPPSRWSPI